MNVNTASKQLLTYVGRRSRLRHGSSVERDGPFRSRPTDERSRGLVKATAGAGFRHSGRHQSSRCQRSASRNLSLNQMAKDLNCSVSNLMKVKSQKKVDLSKYVSDTVGMPTLTDIGRTGEAGRDRGKFEVVQFAEGDQHPRGPQAWHGGWSQHPAFGVFVDIGVHQDGLVHHRQLS